ncbi:signal peptidase II [Saliterribacillus persicus]|uniref:Lipoprotein signal peptidase n=1 Tax=Saliterribacillus persicus TaxID=930114 RepID=A0A368XS49_9BACI|nr:signal peptidase II [Saliterribacillus persicus]RCW70783.1 signal peptidase II [Saliterribacillus persicus]
MWVYVLAIIVIIFDQISKALIVSRMALGESIEMIENVFYITSHRNTGAAWGIFAGQMTFFYIITVIVVAFIIYYIQKYAKDSKTLGVGLGLVLGGAIGNFIDRLFRKEVVDFFDIYIGTYDYPIFNIADSALVTGVILIFATTILDESKKKRGITS